MIPVRVIFLPSLLQTDDIKGKAVAVFDVLRATTSIAAAMQAGAKEIRLFGSIDTARDAACGCTDPKLLAGELDCLPPEGFDLGNSPGHYIDKTCRDKIICFSTTNGTKALLAAREAAKLYAAALVNARATAIALELTDLPVTLLCAGTAGQIAMEDIIGCGAVLSHLLDSQFGQYKPANDKARIALSLFESAMDDLPKFLSESQGGINIRSANLSDDILFAARFNSIEIACPVMMKDGNLIVFNNSSGIA